MFKEKKHTISVLFQPLDLIKWLQPVGLKLWSTQSATTDPIGLAKKEGECAFRNLMVYLQ